jgi:hypothetical protein
MIRRKYSLPVMTNKTAARTQTAVMLTLFAMLAFALIQSRGGAEIAARDSAKASPHPMETGSISAGTRGR